MKVDPQIFADMFYISPERVSGVNCTYVGDRNLTSREEVVELFADTAATYHSMLQIIGENDTSLTMEDLVTAAKGILSHSVAWEFRYVWSGWRGNWYGAPYQISIMGN